MAARIDVKLGAFAFSSGYTPQTIAGPQREMYVIEHQIPAKEGGVIEYVGSRQPTYQLRGFLAPSNETYNGPAGAVLSGTSYVGVNADDAKDFLIGIRASGAHLLRIESTFSKESGFARFYENDFFWITQENFGYEAAKQYPYYPYTLDLRRASIKTYGQSSGAGNFPFVSGVYFSGYTHGFRERAAINSGGLTKGELPTALGVYVTSVASGNAKLALYDGIGALVAQTASQALHSGWNYFPLRPTSGVGSGVVFELAIKGDAANDSGYVIAMLDAANTSGTTDRVSGVGYSADFPASFGGQGLISGTQWNLVQVTA